MRSNVWRRIRTSSGMKESGSDIAQIAEFVARTPDDFTVLAGSATTFVHALCAGCDGAILALAALVPDACVELATLVRERRLDEARALQRRLLPLAQIGRRHLRRARTQSCATTYWVLPADRRGRRFVPRLLQSSIPPRSARRARRASTRARCRPPVTTLIHHCHATTFN